MVHLPSFVHLFSLHNTIILCVLIFVVFTSGGAIFTSKTLRRLPLNADYLENKLGTPIFSFQIWNQHKILLRKIEVLKKA